MNARTEFEINESTYQWCVRAFSLVHSRLGINVKVHDADGKIAAGQIFLFNHFARFETVIPQYIIHEATGAFCRCVAAAELFDGKEAFTKFLWSVGAVPTDHPGLLAFLAAEILRGRKVIVFPEGGMIKDRRVVDDQGEISIFSPSDQAQRKHHRGAAAIALTLEVFKKRILLVHEDGDRPRLQRWVDALGLESIDSLIEAARQRTLVVPGNITFFPIRNDDNILRKAAAMFGREIGPAAHEELLIEGNILLKNTDMDVRFGRPIAPGVGWNWWERRVLQHLFERIDSLQDLFALKPDSDRWIDRMVSMALGRRTRILRDEYARGIYACVTINLSHLASRLILSLLDQGTTEISHESFHGLIYVSIKNAQKEPSIHLHRSLSNPERYNGIHKGVWQLFERFLDMATASDLIEILPDRYRFLPKLQQQHSFHEVRLENAITVYANEIAPVSAASRSVDMAIESNSAANNQTMARLLFDDEIRTYEWCQENYSRRQYAHINDQETATEDGEPYLLVPENAGKIGVVLIHGFLASPAELREFGNKLAALGYPVIGVRLAGHGTSPWDLRDRSWDDWLGSVRRGVEIMSAFTDKVCLIGFSTGGALSLRLAAECPEKFIGVAAVSVPVKFRNRNLIFVPIVHGINKLAQWMSSLEGLMPFQPNDSEQPAINYRHIPIRGLFELRRLVDDMRRRLVDVTCPVAVFQGTDDPIIDSKSAELILDKIASKETSLHMIPSSRHGILIEDIGGTQELVISFLLSLASPGANAGACEEAAPRTQGEPDVGAAI
jgi:esterase/lipase/1-acyl-sn-glycerol-3-phosphate acyltransferase